MSEKGIHPVSVILMVAITVVLASVIGAWVLGFDGSGTDMDLQVRLIMALTPFVGVFGSIFLISVYCRV